MKRIRIPAAAIFGGAVFIAAAVFVTVTLGRASQASEQERLEQVRRTVENGVTLCYSVEGAYPQSVEYLTDNYGVVYDSEKYLVHYERFASNVRPVVTVIRRES